MGPASRSVLTIVAFSITAEIGVIFVRWALVQICVIGNQVFRSLLTEEGVRTQTVAGRPQCVKPRPRQSGHIGPAALSAGKWEKPQSRSRDSGEQEPRFLQKGSDGDPGGQRSK